ncbi:MAG: hypothetical protein ACE5DK_07540 [Paracoccaceae bacterium]
MGGPPHARSIGLERTDTIPRAPNAARIDAVSGCVPRAIIRTAWTDSPNASGTGNPSRARWASRLARAP